MLQNILRDFQVFRKGLLCNQMHRMIARLFANTLNTLTNQRRRRILSVPPTNPDRSIIHALAQFMIIDIPFDHGLEQLFQIILYIAVLFFMKICRNPLQTCTPGQIIDHPVQRKASRKTAILLVCRYRHFHAPENAFWQTLLHARFLLLTCKILQNSGRFTPVPTM